ncbi:Ectoine/5-hydroxyectoine TRAP transporter small permease protein UehB [Thauera mechernichensis]|jgi:TRAP-type C4-dicarboxylate transport system permease small subunit
MKCETAAPTRSASAVADVAGGARAGIWERIESGALLGFATILFLAATAIMLIEGAGRSFFDESYFWAEEAVRYLMVWAFFLTLGAAGTAGNHIRTELLVERMPAGIRRAMNMLASVAGVVFSGALLYASLPQVHRYYTMGMMTESNLDLPMWLLFLAMPLGALLLLAYYLRCLVRVLRGEDPYAATHGPTGSEL